MNAEKYLQQLIEHGKRLDTLLLLQALLQQDHRQLKDEQPEKAAFMLRSARKLTQQILAAYDRQDQLYTRARRLIERLPQQPERDILLLCYLRNMTVEEAAPLMNYSPRHCYRLRRRALMHLNALEMSNS